MGFSFSALFAAPVLLIAACGGGTFTSVSSDGGADSSVIDGATSGDGGGACVPKTCVDLHWACGTGGDGCGKTIDCGRCHVPGFECGASGTPHACGCKPKSCTDLGFTCGDAADGCGGTLHCGTCTTPESCGGAGMDHRCGIGTCVKKACQAIGATCGTPSDGCGGTLDCGHCPGANDVCTMAYQCQCVPSSCGQLGWQCGSGSDGCNGTINCGGCSGGNDVCTNHACVSGGCVPTTSCQQKGYTCGVIYNGCANESCGSGPPLREMAGDQLCIAHSGKPVYYSCLCMSGVGPQRDDGGNGPNNDGGSTCTSGAPNPPVPGWSCDVVSTAPNGDALSFCCAQ